jgi:superfamily I DNA and/or RNA helicase
VDEAGATSEQDIPVLLLLKPNNLVLIGDHLQLPPPSSSREKFGSLMERCSRNSRFDIFALQMQYRMHPKICRLVSALMYEQHNIKLQTDKAVAIQREENAAGHYPMLIVRVQKPAAKEHNEMQERQSYINHHEAKVSECL